MSVNIADVQNVLTIEKVWHTHYIVKYTYRHGINMLRFSLYSPSERLMSSPFIVYIV